MDSLQRKGINFDLNTQALKEYYPKGDWHNAYADVRDFFEQTDLSIFRDRESFGGSNVRSKSLAVIYQMTKEFPWLNYCVMCVPYQMYRNC